ncbi:uncharacterized protein LOC130247306 isoform X1 [Danio aesculapii]|uniref:uncharacterized protein LOC130247306 isoform X1 n=1 Tax=Danio aesculapii TaxID=1142201 RepID=UPI0024BF14B5|nr:uncharacterized protein LOC130247306 isoform X1 [Danio aesculapii]
MQCMMQYCKYTSASQNLLLRHYRLKHWYPSRCVPLVCLFPECVCTFKTPGALKSHLYRVHTNFDKRTEQATFNCDLCDYHNVCCEKVFMQHLGTYLKRNKTVQCPFLHCNFQTNVYVTFHSHKSKHHKTQTASDYKSSVVTVSRRDSDNSPDSTSECFEDTSHKEIESEADEVDVDQILEKKLASLFLCMQTELGVSRNATKQIFHCLNEIQILSKPSIEKVIQDILCNHNCNVEQSVITEITEAVHRINPLYATTEKGTLSTDYKWNIYFKQHFDVVEPVEFVFSRPKNKTFVYVPILEVLKKFLSTSQKTFSNTSTNGFYASCFDGQHFKEHPLLCAENFFISLGLYIDDFEVANPLGTSRKKHKITAVYWVILNWPSQFRTNLHSIQLALLGKSCDVREYGYDMFFEPLMKDIQTLEKEGLYVDQFGENFKGTVVTVSADNLGAHGLAGFQECFHVGKFCRFCLASFQDIQTSSVSKGHFPLRNIQQHNQFVEELKANQALSNVQGVKGECVLQSHLDWFHPVTGFPPDPLHDLFEGIVPFELSLCLQRLIAEKYFTLDQLNGTIQSFPYCFSDKVNRPQKIPKSFSSKKSIGGNGHENWTLIRLLPLMIGHIVPETNTAWQLLMELKDIVELVVSPKFSEDSLSYLETKIFDHRSLFQEVFPNEKLKPKHHFLEHYPGLIRYFGSCVELWTMRFEAKHSFFKQVVHNTHNYKNILQTLSTQHQLMVAHALQSPNFF